MPESLPAGFKLIATLQGHSQRIAAPAWHSDGIRLASGSDDGTVKIWDALAGRLLETLEGPGSPVGRVAWSNDGAMLAAGCADGTVRVWATQNGFLLSDLRLSSSDRDWSFNLERRALVRSVAWSPSGGELAIASDDFTLRRVRFPSGNLIATYECDDRVTSVAYSRYGSMLAMGTDSGVIKIVYPATGEERILHHHSSHVLDVVWSADGSFLVSASSDSRICVWRRDVGRVTHWLEGHQRSIGGLSLSYDGSLLASKSNADDTVRLWRTDNWRTIATLEEPGCALPMWWHNGLAFNPRTAVLATLGDEDRAIRIWELDVAQLFREKAKAIHYRSARVVLVGESGVGKTSLGMALRGETFSPQESTHGRQVSLLNQFRQDLPNGGEEVRELFLWDLAGQPGYRLTHQLHLSEANLALVVFDSRQDVDPLAGAKYWTRALRQSRLASSASKRPLVMFLIAARYDRAGLPGSRSKLVRWAEENGFSLFFETSAKTLHGIDELRERIRKSIEWDQLPSTTSSWDLKLVNDFLLEQKRAGKVLVSEEELFREFNESQHAQLSNELFSSALFCLETRGSLKRLSFGGLTLLQPEVLDTYASAIVIAAKEEPAGLGVIAEEAVAECISRLDGGVRVASEWQERLVLIATVEEMLRSEIALREPAFAGNVLVFPSQLSREREPHQFESKVPAVVFDFEGATQTVYATLIVRLSQSGLFIRTEMWSGSASFSFGGEPLYEILARELEDGKGELAIYFSATSDLTARQSFEQYVRLHLNRRASAGSVKSHRTSTCPECGTPVTELQADRRRSRGFQWINCGVCESRVVLHDAPEPSRQLETAPLVDELANRNRDSQVSATILLGKLETNDFDVFLSYNGEDREAVCQLADHLRSYGIHPWLDQEQVRPGRFFVDGIERAMDRAKAAAIVIGPHGASDWHRFESRKLLKFCVKTGIALIPVLLPGVVEVPEDLSFLSELSMVRFKDTLVDITALRSLVWGITGERALAQAGH
jgi:GTPase SAR1 family protein